MVFFHLCEWRRIARGCGRTWRRRRREEEEEGWWMKESWWVDENCWVEESWWVEEKRWVEGELMSGRGFQGGDSTSLWSYIRQSSYIHMISIIIAPYIQQQHRLSDQIDKTRSLHSFTRSALVTRVSMYGPLMIPFIHDFSRIRESSHSKICSPAPPLSQIIYLPWRIDVVKRFFATLT